MSGRYRLIVALLLFLVGMVNYMDRAAMGILAPAMKSDLHFTESQLGIVFSAFFAGYAVFSFLGGYFSDRFGPKKTFFIAAIAWSIFCAATGVVTSVAALIGVRILFGASEGPMNSTTNRMITNWFPRKETARALGFSLSGQNFGSALAAPLSVLIASLLGWRLSFVVLGSLGLIWSVFWFFLVKDNPASSRFVSEAEQAHIVSDRQVAQNVSEEPVGSLRHYLLAPTTLAMAAGLFAHLYILYIFISWLPSYLVSVLHVSTKGLAGAAMVPWIGGFIGYAGGGLVSDFFFKRSSNRLRARKATTIVPLLSAVAALVGVLFVTNVVLAVLVLGFALMMLSAGMQSLWAMIHELVPAARMGSVGGFIHLLANLSGVISPALTGFVVQYSGGYGPAFLIAVAIGVIGSGLMATVIRHKGPAGRVVPPSAAATKSY